jgi:hypothetical protein
MKKTIASRFALGALALFVVTITGCSGESFNTVPVSGTVTLDGEPLPGVEVVFYPEPTESTAVVGPFSVATTDSAGKFTLETRYGEAGAVVGKHRVTFAYGDVDQEAIYDAEAAEMEAKGEGESLTSEEKSAAKEANSQLGKRKQIPNMYGEDSEVTIEVPAGGMSNADFPLKSN